MANWSILKAAIAKSIKNNSNQEITGQVLQNVLNNIVSVIGANATFAGIATPTTNPGAPDGPVFYLAIEKGIYSNFAGTELNGKELTILYNSTSGNWLSSSLGGANAVSMNPYFPFAESATFFLNRFNNAGLSREEAENLIFGIWIDQGPKTDKMYLGRLEKLVSSGNLVIKLCINNIVKLQAIDIKPSDKISIAELLPVNDSGYHGYIAIIPNNRISNTFIETNYGTFENFALSENIFNRCPLFDSYLNEQAIDEIKAIDDIKAIDENNLLNSIYKWPELYKAVEENLPVSQIRHVYPTDVTSDYPRFLWGKKQFFFSKDLGETVQTFWQREIRVREVSNISFSTWLYCSSSSGSLVKRLTIKFALGKQYPVGFAHNETSFEITILSNTDYSAASYDNPLKYTLPNTVIGDIEYYIDKEIKYTDGRKFIHIRFDKEIPIRYGNLYFNANASYITANNKLGADIAIIDPVLTTTDPYKYESDYSAYNYGYSIAIGDISVSGKTGRVNEKPVKSITNIELITQSITSAKLKVIDNKSSVDLELSAISLIEPNYVNTVRFNSGYYYPLFESTGKFYIQFGIKIKDVAQITQMRNQSARIFQPLELLSEGLKITTSNDYENPMGTVLKITDDGIAIIRLQVYAGALNSGFNYGFNIQSSHAISSIKLYNFCISEKPIDPDKGIFISKQRLHYPTLAGKSFTIFGDSEFNSGLQFLNVTSRLGMPCYSATYGGHKMAWENSTSVDPVTKSWLYSWDIRKLVLANNTDLYIFCVSTNDANAGIKLEESNSGKYDYQSVEDADVQYVLDNYPSYGDTDEEVQQKIQAFDALDSSTKHQKFNMSSVYCAYIEQILEANPKAKIILTNSPITCTGLLTGSVGPDGKGVWNEGENPKTARSKRKIIFDRLDELMRKIADKYNLPVIDFYRNVGLTFENYIDYCIDGTHWVDIKNNDILSNTNPIPNREGDLLVKYILEMAH